MGFEIAIFAVLLASSGDADFRAQNDMARQEADRFFIAADATAAEARLRELLQEEPALHVRVICNRPIAQQLEKLVELQGVQLIPVESTDDVRLLVLASFFLGGDPVEPDNYLHYLNGERVGRGIRGIEASLAAIRRIDEDKKLLVCQREWSSRDSELAAIQWAAIESNGPGWRGDYPHRFSARLTNLLSMRVCVLMTYACDDLRRLSRQRFRRR